MSEKDDREFVTMVFGCRESTGAYGRSQVLLVVRGSNGVRIFEKFRTREL